MLPGRVSGFLAIALGLFIGAAVALNLNLPRLRDSFAWVEHANQVLRNISASERALLEAESGERGYATAIPIYRMLADQGDPYAQRALGIMYDMGQGVSQNYVEAMKWFRKAADRGDVDAQNSLGLMYAQGQGVLQDYVQAHMWFNLSAAQGNNTAE